MGRNVKASKLGSPFVLTIFEYSGYRQDTEDWEEENIESNPEKKILTAGFHAYSQRKMQTAITKAR